MQFKDLAKLQASAFNRHHCGSGNLLIYGSVVGDDSAELLHRFPDL